MNRQIMKVEMFGKTLAIRYVQGTDYEYRVYEIVNQYKKMHLDSFESFQEAWTFVEEELFA